MNKVYIKVRQHPSKAWLEPESLVQSTLVLQNNYLMDQIRVSYKSHGFVQWRRLVSLGQRKDVKVSFTGGRNQT